MIIMYEINMTSALDANACLTPRGVTRPLVAGVGAIGEELPPQVDEASEMDLAPEVAAHLKQVLANIDPIYHVVFVSMYKVLVPIFFRP
jgi:hypothetical protein